MGQGRHDQNALVIARVVLSVLRMLAAELVERVGDRERENADSGSLSALILYRDLYSRFHPSIATSSFHPSSLLQQCRDPHVHGQASRNFSFSAVPSLPCTLHQGNRFFSSLLLLGHRLLFHRELIY